MKAGSTNSFKVLLLDFQYLEYRVLVVGFCGPRSPFINCNTVLVDFCCFDSLKKLVGNIIAFNTAVHLLCIGKASVPVPLVNLAFFQAKKFCQPLNLLLRPVLILLELNL
mmetsp:Transcript_20975/g.15390  ORF Transcript_20975/g.15390 Transcript_20975/m.15390 type:complete len:110 (-) Transcript_20975:675-1004(-)